MIKVLILAAVTTVTWNMPQYYASGEPYNAALHNHYNLELTSCTDGSLVGRIDNYLYEDIEIPLIPGFINDVKLDIQAVDRNELASDFSETPCMYEAE